MIDKSNMTEQVISRFFFFCAVMLKVIIIFITQVKRITFFQRIMVFGFCCGFLKKKKK